MKPILFDLSYNLNLSAQVRQKLDAELGSLTLRNFPDGESSIKVMEDCEDREVIVMADLSHPNEKVLPLLLLTRILRERKAKEINLIAPYLPYMRQDAQFTSGESQLARHFAELLSAHFDKVITVEPHLHRILRLDTIFSIPTETVHSTIPIAEWVKNHVKNPLFIGPDMESSQWVSPLARQLQQPFLVAEKSRKGDQDVSIIIKGLDHCQGHTPVVIDDIISTGYTMVGIGQRLKDEGFNESICIATHAIFSGDAYMRLSKNYFDKVITTNTVPHISNQIDVSEEIYRGYAACGTDKQYGAGL
ncbi:ribose-phosphate diphosphokinase [Kangiella shandongensis]|uniref:ribose-phosphate diphosphokinase n=1 Tax=Kangiella shandongensis TaxID=2763258 RepID=UPI001CBD17E8|nr:ribose-phosphate diphosphokinase [Kangiella shandongensis]